MNEKSRNKRRSKRVNFVYPVTFKLFSQGSSSRCLNGLFKNISIIGANIHFKDKYGLIDPLTIIDSRAKIELNIFGEDKVFLFATVRSITETNKKNEPAYQIGVEFEKLEKWQEENIKRIFNLRDKEHKMMWNLLDRNQEEILN